MLYDCTPFVFVSEQTSVNHLFTCLTDEASTSEHCLTRVNNQSQGSSFTFIKTECKTAASTGRKTTCLEGDWACV